MTSESKTQTDAHAQDDLTTETTRFVAYFPERGEGLEAVVLPIAEVTLLEDRAQVARVGRVTLKAGRNRLLVEGVAPILQDVSLRAELSIGQAGDGGDQGAANVSDVHVRRAYRVVREDKPEQVAELEATLEALQERFSKTSQTRQHLEERYQVVMEMLRKSLAETPQDAAWGIANPQLWRDTFSSLTQRGRKLLDEVLDRYFEQLDIRDEARRVIAARQAFDRMDAHLTAWVELDVHTEEAQDVELSLYYVVPNALWRPMHSAQLLDDGTLTFETKAAVWQCTGEDWRDVKLSFSTARSSLGTEPPLLSDDFLQAQRRPDKLVVERRQVAMQSTGLGREPGASGAPPASPVELPGVDDGGDVQTLRAEGSTTVQGDGRLHTVPVFELSAKAESELVCMPELEAKVFLKAVLKNDATMPILAGPVELLRDGGFIGWTKVLYVAPGELFELSFGHEDGLRVYRTQRHESEIDEHGWTHNDAVVSVHLSNLDGIERELTLTERIPVAEISHVRVSLDRQRCTPPLAEVDPENGFCSWSVNLPAHGQQALHLVYRLSTAADVEGV
jgi:uncharacterized protein (TIGR02231 family)